MHILHIGKGKSEGYSGPFEVSIVGTAIYAGLLPTQNPNFIGCTPDY